MPSKAGNPPEPPCEKTGLSIRYDDVAAKVNEYMSSSARNMAKMGEYLVNVFFDGDIKKARRRSSHKGMSLRKLAQHPEIDCSYATLDRAVNVAVLSMEFQNDSTLNQLNASQLLTLAAVEQPLLRKRYAQKAAKQSLSSRKLKEVLVKDGVVSVRGRGALVESWEKELAQHSLLGVYRACVAIGEIEMGDPSVMEEETAKIALKEAESAKRNLEDMITKLKSRTK